MTLHYDPSRQYDQTSQMTTPHIPFTNQLAYQSSFTPEGFDSKSPFHSYGHSRQASSSSSGPAAPWSDNSMSAHAPQPPEQSWFGDVNTSKSLPDSYQSDKYISPGVNLAMGNRFSQLLKAKLGFEYEAPPPQPNDGGLDIRIPQIYMPQNDWVRAMSYDDSAGIHGPDANLATSLDSTAIETALQDYSQVDIPPDMVVGRPPDYLRAGGHTTVGSHVQYDIGVPPTAPLAQPPYPPPGAYASLPYMDAYQVPKVNGYGQTPYPMPTSAMGPSTHAGPYPAPQQYHSPPKSPLRFQQNPESYQPQLIQVRASTPDLPANPLLPPSLIIPSPYPSSSLSPSQPYMQTRSPHASPRAPPPPLGVQSVGSSPRYLQMTSPAGSWSYESLHAPAVGPQPWDSHPLPISGNPSPSITQLLVPPPPHSIACPTLLAAPAAKPPLPPHSSDPQPIASSSASASGTLNSESSTPTSRRAAHREVGAVDDAPVAKKRGRKPKPKPTEEELQRAADEAAAAATAPEGNDDDEKKMIIACHMCRSRKLKCDGAKPKCHHCSRRNEDDCVYDSILRRRGPGKNNKRDRGKRRRPADNENGSGKRARPDEGDRPYAGPYGHPYGAPMPSSSGFPSVLATSSVRQESNGTWYGSRFEVSTARE